ncbi:uncharacterized protein LOC127425358 [Myxocyprinus asiaticus]|uniref:uncharacterized protein LOC127425358 n=1 Tax=Myxocyprinus asiaticus TaxID=70543 RepID=UPI002221716D|nr:uncharacterized protein LOC127425358 [Myxocyprinus asiaticus]
MNPVIQLLRLHQGNRPLEDYVEDFCALACQVDFNEVALKDIFRFGLIESISLLMPGGQSTHSLAQYIDLALQIIGSTFTVEEADAELEFHVMVTELAPSFAPDPESAPCHVTATPEPAPCHVTATPVPAPCHVTATPEPAPCHVTAMPQCAPCHVTAKLQSAPCKVSGSSLANEPALQASFVPEPSLTGLFELELVPTLVPILSSPDQARGTFDPLTPS